MNKEELIQEIEDDIKELNELNIKTDKTSYSVTQYGLSTYKTKQTFKTLADKLNDHKLPLWLNEGLATYLSDYSVDWNEGLVISNAIAANKILELNDINQLMKLNTASANLAYLEAKIAAEYLINQIGISKLPEFLDDLNKYDNIDFVFEKYLGYDLIDFEYYWYNYLKDKYQWMVVLNFDNLIWLMLIFVVIIAYIVVKMRNYKKIQMWKSDELEEYTED